MSELITLDKFKKAIMNSMKSPGMQEGAANALAEHVLNFFGFQDRIIDNMLDPEDRDAFYMLEDVGLLTTEREETGLPDGREWRIHYWLLREDRVQRALKVHGLKTEKDTATSESVYDTIPDDIWFRRVPVDEEEEEEEEEIDETEWETPILPGSFPDDQPSALEQALQKRKKQEEEQLEGEEVTKYVSEQSRDEESEEE